MKNLIATNIEETSKTITYAVDIEFEIDGKIYEANVTCILSVDDNIGYDNWDFTIANEDELPDLTEEEIVELQNFAKKYAQKLAE